MKGRKRTKGQPAIHDEFKERFNLTLTRTGVQGLDALAESLGLSRSEFVERIGRGLIPIASDLSRSQPLDLPNGSC